MSENHLPVSASPSAIGDPLQRSGGHSHGGLVSPSDLVGSLFVFCVVEASLIGGRARRLDECGRLMLEKRD